MTNPSPAELRFSDKELHALRKDFQEHKAVCNTNHETLQHLIVDISSGQKANTEAIQALTSSTRDLVAVWDSAETVLKVGSALGRFGKWLTSVAFVGVAIAWCIGKYDGG